MSSQEALGELRLVEDTACGCAADIVCLTLEAAADDARPAPGTQVVSWSGRPDTRVREVRVAGVAAATIAVR